MRRLKDTVEELDKDEGGAVLLLACVGVIILMLTAWAMYDTGFAVRDKQNVQAAADVSAYSQASIKSRSMNMMAYTNIAKRSIWGVHSLYPAYLKASYDWIRHTIEGNCDACYEGSDKKGNGGNTGRKCNLCNTAMTEVNRWRGETCGPSSCEGSTPAPETQWGWWRHLHGSEYADNYMKLNDNGTKLADSDRFEIGDKGATVLSPSDPYQSLTYRYYGQDLRALDNYQRYMYGLTPWWAWSEQMMRAMRSGASAAGSWPMPSGEWPMQVWQRLQRLVSRFSTIYSGPGGSAEMSIFSDTLPVYPSKAGAMRAHLLDAVDGAEKNLVNTVISCVEAIFGGGSCSVSDTIHPFLIEHLANGLIFTLKSEGVVGFKDGINNGRCPSSSQPGGILSSLLPIPAPSCIHRSALFKYIKDGIEYTHNSMNNVMNNSALMDGREDRIVAEPWRLLPARNESEWNRQMSNIILTYKARPGVFDEDRQRAKYNIFTNYDHRGDNSSLSWKSYLYGSDIVPALGPDMVRQQVTYSASGVWGIARSEIYFDGEEPDLWHPSWSARLRPVSLEGELSEGDYNMRKVYHSIIPGMLMGSLLGLSSVYDLQAMIVDFAYMDRVAKSLDQHYGEGIVK